MTISEVGLEKMTTLNYHEVMNIFNGERNMMTDLGVPAVVGVSIPHVTGHRASALLKKQNETSVVKYNYEFR